MTARILVVDDIEANVRLLEAKLSAEYYEVISASDGPTALEKSAASRSSPTNVMENRGDCRFAQEISTAAAPGCKSCGGSTIKEAGEEASTIVRCIAMVT